MPVNWWGVLLIILLVIINAFFASSEIAVLSSRRARIEKLREEGNKSAETVIRLLEDPSFFLSTIQVGITLAGFFASAAGAVGLSQALAAVLSDKGIPAGLANTLAILIITVLISYITLVFGELAPKRLAMQWSERIALKVAGPIELLSRFTSPVTKLLTLSTNLVVRLFGGNPLEQEKEMSEDEIRFYVAKNKKLPLEEKQMIEAVFDFGDQVVRQVMVPRTEIIHLQASDSIKDALEKVCRTGYQAFPVYREDYDDIIGMVKIQDLTCHLLDGQNLTLADITAPILFVPETKDTVELLKEFRAKKTSIAIVVDEYGGTAGLVTIEDLVDELIGDIIQDQDSIQKTSEGQWLVEGDTPIQTIVELLNIKTIIPDANYETVAGFMLEQLGHLPVEGEIVTYDDYQFLVKEMDVRRIKKLLIKKIM